MFSSRKKWLIVAFALTFGWHAAQAQENDKLNDDRQLLLEAEEAEREAAQRDMEAATMEMEVALEQHQEAMRSRTDSADAEAAMRQAERALAAAAQQMAELSLGRLPNISGRIARGNRGPLLGITIGDSDEEGPVEGVTILGVSPSGAAAESGLQAGDVITSLNGEPLAADSSGDADAKLMDFMYGVEAGDTLDVEFLRDRRAETVKLQPKAMQRNSFAFRFNDDDFVVPDVDVSPGTVGINRFVWMGERGSFGDMELVKLTEDLGSYFGTDEGLLVVRAPENVELKLKDGDVIRNIDGREPSSASHAMRILSSYESGETVQIEIMRDQRSQTISIALPDNLRSWNEQVPVAPAAPVAPTPRVAPVP